MPMKVLGVMLTAIMAIAAPKRSIPNFSGVWTLDLAKSNLGPAGDMQQPAAMEVSHQGNRLAVVEVVREADGKSLMERNYTLDGRETAVAVPDGIEFISARRAGRDLRVQSIQRHGQVVIITLEEWALSRDGRELSIKRRGGRSIQKLVFRRSIETATQYQRFHLRSVRFSDNLSRTRCSSRLGS